MYIFIYYWKSCFYTLNTIIDDVDHMKLLNIRRKSGSAFFCCEDLRSGSSRVIDAPASSPTSVDGTRASVYCVREEDSHHSSAPKVIPIEAQGDAKAGRGGVPVGRWVKRFTMMMLIW